MGWERGEIGGDKVLVLSMNNDISFNFPLAFAIISKLPSPSSRPSRPSPGSPPSPSPPHLLRQIHFLVFVACLRPTYSFALPRTHLSFRSNQSQTFKSSFFCFCCTSSPYLFFRSSEDPLFLLSLARGKGGR